MRLKNIVTIIKKELRSHFDSPTAYIVLVLFLFLWEFLFFRGAFLAGEASVRILFEYLPWLLLFLVPAITMGSVSQEKSEGTLELLLTHPLKSIDLVLGKFFASVGMVVLALLFAIPVAWSLSSFGVLDWGIVAGQLMGSLGMVLVLASLGIFISTLFASQISALLVTIFVAFFLTIAGFGLVTDRLTSGVAKISEQLSVFSHYQSMIRGVVDIRDVFYFLSVTVVFLALAHLQFIKLKYGNKRKVYRNQLSTVIIVVGVIVLINVVGAHIPGRLDLTQNKLYTLSDTTKEIITQAEDQIEVTLYVSRELPAQVQPSLREVEDVLRDYETLSGGKVDFSSKTPEADVEIANEAESKGIFPIQFNVIGQEEFQVKKGYFGLAVSYGEDVEVIPFIQNTGDLEYQVTSFIKKLTTTDKKKLVYLTDHGDKSLSQDYRILQQELEGFYDVKNVDTFEQDEEGKNPLDSADALMLAGLNQSLEEESKEALLEYIRSGGSVFFLMDRLLIDPQTNAVNENEESGSDILEILGINVQKDLVYDRKSHERVTIGGGPISYLAPYPFFVRALSASDTPAFGKDIKSITLTWPNSIEVDNEKLEESGFSMQGLFSTTQFGGHQTEAFLLAPDQTFSTAQEGVYILASSFMNDENGGRLVVVGDSDFLTDQFAGNKVENLAFALEAISWLIQDESLAQIKLKQTSNRQLLFENEEQIAFVKFGNIGFAVVLPVLIGLGRYWRRKKLLKRRYE